MSKPLLLFTAPVGTRSGYGAHSRDIARSLIAMDKFDVRIFPVRWGSTPQNALNEKDSNDIDIILDIKSLLYDRKYTIKGARQHLNQPSKKLIQTDY